MRCDCPPFAGSIEDFLCTNQACNDKEVVCGVYALFVLEVRDAVTAGKRVSL